MKPVIDPANESPLDRADAYYASVGRVVSHAALMEQWTFYLADTLDRQALQQEHAGKHGQSLVEVCLRHLDQVERPLRDEIETLLTDIELVLRERNTVVHSVAVQPGDPVAYAHRPLPKSQRVGGDHNWIGDTYLTAEHLDEVDTRILGLIERLMSVRPRAERM